MTYGSRSFAVSTAAPAAPLVDLRRVGRAGVVVGPCIDHPPSPRDAPPPVRPGAVVRFVAATHGITPEEIFGRSHLRRVAHARRDAMVQVAKLMPTWSVSRVAHYFRRDHTTVLYAFNRAGYAHGRAANQRQPTEACAARQAQKAEWHRRKAEGDEGIYTTALLTVDAVRAIRAAPRVRHWAKRFAREYGVSVKSVWDARSRRTWKRLT